MKTIHLSGQNWVYVNNERVSTTNYNSHFGYIEGDYSKTEFEFKGKKYKIEYFSGCFNPFLLELI